MSDVRYYLQMLLRLVVVSLLLSIAGFTQTVDREFTSLQDFLCSAHKVAPPLSKAAASQLKQDAPAVIRILMKEAERLAYAGSAAEAARKLTRVRALQSILDTLPAEPNGREFCDPPARAEPLGAAIDPAPTPIPTTKPPVPSGSVAGGKLFQINTSDIDFGVVEPEGPRITRTVEIFSNNEEVSWFDVLTPSARANSAFLIRREHCDSVSKGSACRLRITFQPTGASDYTEPLHVRGRSKNKTELVEAMLFARVKKKAPPVKVTVTPGEIDFGQVQVGSKSSAFTVTFMNSGEGAVTIADVTATSSSFVTEDNGCVKRTLESQKSCTVAVRFLPGSAVGERAELEFDLGAQVPLHKITLQGRGLTRFQKPLVITPGALLFPEQEVGTSSKPLAIAIKNTAAEAVGDFSCTLSIQMPAPSRPIPPGPVFRFPPCGNGSLAGSAQADINVSFEPTFAGRFRGVLTISWKSNFADGTAVPESQEVVLEGVGYVAGLVDLSNTTGSSDLPSTRFLAGIDLSGASSLDIEQKYFLSVMLHAPIGSILGNSYPDPLGKRWWLAFNPRIVSLPQAATADVASLTSSGDFFSPVLTSNVNKIVHAFDFSGGPEFALLKPRNGIPFWTSIRNTHARLGVSLFASAGFTSPFSLSRAAGQYQINAAALRFLV